MASNGTQQKLIDMPAQLKNGLLYRPDFISEEEEQTLLATIRALPLERPLYRGEYLAKRRSMGFGWGYDFDRKRLIPGPPLPRFLQPLQRKIAKWLDIPRRRIAEALVTEYAPGAAIGWHRDNEEFEHVIGVSLDGWCHMRFRPVRGRVGYEELAHYNRGEHVQRSRESGYATGAFGHPASNGIRPAKSLGRTSEGCFSLDLEPRSIYVMQKAVRWDWQHRIPPTKTMRYSITFRSLPAAQRR